MLIILRIILNIKLISLSLHRQKQKPQGFFEKDFLAALIFKNMKERCSKDLSLKHLGREPLLLLSVHKINHFFLQQ